MLTTCRDDNVGKFIQEKLALTLEFTVAEHLYQDHTPDQFTALLVDQEWEDRQNRKIKNLIRQAGFRLPVSTHDIDYTSKRKLDKNQFERLLSLQFMQQAENIIFIGSTGVGKSYLAQAIGTAACQMLYRVQYYNTARLMEQVKITKLDGTARRPFISNCSNDCRKLIY